MPQEDKLSTARALSRQYVLPKTEVQKPKSITGFAENAFDDAKEIAEGLINLVPYVAKGTYGVLSRPEDWSFENFVAATGNTTKNILNALISNYTTYGWDVWYHKPMSVALDALAVLDLGGTAAVRTGAGMSKIAKFAEAGKTLEKFGEQMRSVPGYLGKQVQELPLKAVGINPESRRLITETRRTELPNAEKYSKVFEATITKPYLATLTDAEIELFNFKRKAGLLPEESTAFKASAPAVEADRKVSEWVRGIREGELGEETRRLLTKEGMEGALIKKAADARGISISEMRDLWPKLEFRPEYVPAIRESAAGFTLVDASHTPTVIKAGKVGSLEKFKTFKGSVEDPAIYMQKAVEDFYKTRANLRLIDVVLQQGWKKGWVQAGKGGFELPTQGAYAKYFEDQARLNTLVLKGVLKKDLTPDQAIAKLREPAAADALRQNVGVTIADKTLASMLTKEFVKLGGEPGYVLRLYDRILGHFKSLVTVFNPRWYTGNVVGDAILAAMAGADWSMWRELIKASPQFKVTGKLLRDEVGVGVAGKIGRKADFFADAVGEFEAAFRAGIFTKEGLRRAKAFLGEFAATEDAMRRFLGEVAIAPHELNNYLSKLQLVEEHIVRNTPTIARLDAQIASKAKQVTVVSQKANVLRENVRQGIAAEERSTGGAARAQRINARLEEINKARPAITRLAEEAKARSKRILSEAEQRFITRFGEVLPRWADRITPTAEIVGKRGRKLGKEVGEWASELNAIKANLRREAQGLISELKAIGEVGVAEKWKAMKLRAAELDQQAAQLMDVARPLIDKRGAVISEMRDWLVKREGYMKDIPGWERKAELANHLYDRANAFLGEYYGLGPLERSVMKRIIPFYPWAKAMAKLTFTYPFMAPTRAFAWHKLASAAASMAGDDELPEWLAPYLPVFVTKEGNYIWLKLIGGNPFAGTGRTQFYREPIPKLIAFWENNPAVATLQTGIGYKGQFSQATIPYGEPVVSLVDGSVYKFKGEGEIEKILPAPPLTTYLSNMFPITQMMSQLISRHDVRKGPTLNPDGTYRFPKEWWQALLEFVGIKTVVGKKEDIERMGRMKVRNMVVKLRGAYKTGTPEEQEQIKQVLQEYANGQLKVKYR